MTSRRPADWLPLGEARDRILDRVGPLTTETRPLASCQGYVLAQDVVSPIELPSHDNSGMDGFAAMAGDVVGASAESPRELIVTGDVAAGDEAAEPLAPGTAVRVMTGAPIPAGADTVVRVEHTDGVRIEPDGRRTVMILSDADTGRNVRPRGEDLRRGDRVLRRGAVLGPGAIGVAASVGCARLAVVRRPVVAVLTSGDELVDITGFGEVLAGRRKVSSNTYSLAAQLEEIGIPTRDLGIAPDDPARMREMLAGARGADALITSAGVSMGERDLVRSVLAELGAEIDFWRVKMKPGSPFAFGRVDGLGGIPWFGLPGNPVSSMVTFEVLVRPALLRMCGRSSVFPPTVAARVTERVRGSEGLTDLLRVRLRASEDAYFATLTGSQGSAILTSMAAADGLLLVPEGCGEVDAGEVLPTLVLGGAPLRETPGF